MRKCERNIINAIKNGECYHDKINAVEILHGKNGDRYLVKLFGNTIATGRVGEMPERFDFCGWNSSTTRSRLRALGCDLYRESKGVYSVSGKKVDYDRPFTCKGNPCKSMYFT